jgi:uncharacterized repeat protein (TIGR01451 family)
VSARGGALASERRHLATLVVAFCVLSWSSSAVAAGTFAYRKAITFNGGPGGVSGGPHPSFPVLVSLVDADLRAKVASPSGYDVVFRGEDPATCGGPAACTLDHEIERWDGETGTLVAWVRVPSLSSTTTIYMYYGNKEVTASTETPRAVWDASYVGVWHLGESGAGNASEYRDSSRYGNHGQGGQGAFDATPTLVANGKIGGGQHFGNADGRYDLIDGGDDGTLRPTGSQITVEAWVRHSITIGAAHGTPPATGIPYGILNVKGWNDGYRLALSGDGGSCGGPITVPCLAFSLPGATDVLTTSAAAPLGPNQWHLVVGTYDGTTMRVFVDGTGQGSRAKSGNISPSVGGESLWIGQVDQPESQPWSGQFEGDLDEVRISRVARSATWIATEFNNQASPGTFCAVGAEAAGSYSPAPLAVNYRSIGTNGTILYSAGTASVALGSAVVTLSGASLPGNVGVGDVLTFSDTPGEPLYILSRDSATQLTLQGPASAHSGQSYTITRAYTSLAAWEIDRQGDLVAENRREIGVAYNDGPFTAGVTIGGSTTDPARYVKLTAAPGQRHLGRAGTGVVVDEGAGSSPAIQILDDFVTVEWLEIRGGAGPGAHGIEIGAGLSPANLVTIANNVIHHVGGDGVRVGDPDAVADIRNNIVYRAAYGIHFPVDMAADARVNVFNNSIYGCTAAPGPSGVKSDVRQKSLRIDLRNNIAHGNANGDFGVSPFFDRGYFCDGACTQIGNGGILGPTEYLADRTRNFTLTFVNAGQSCLYLGSASKFRGVNAGVATAGVTSGVDLAWSYWNGSSWASLETGPFNDGTGSFVWEGTTYWPNDPTGWALTSVSGSPNLYYVRACLASGGYSTYPVEAAITRVDVAIASQNNLASDITGRPHSARWGGQTGLDSVPLANLAFVNTTPGAEDLHINAGSAAQDAALDLGRAFSGDIDGAVRTAPWDIGADEASAGSGPDLSIAKVRTSAPPVVPGSSVAYRMTVTNNGPGTLTSVTVTDTLPVGIRVPAFTPSVGTYDPATGLWAGLGLGPSQSVTLDLLGTVDPRARGTLVNGARVDPPVGVTDPNPANDTATAVDTLSPSANLALGKTGDLDPADLGGLLTYTLAVTNSGPSAATGVVLTDPLAPPTEFDSATASQGACSFDSPTRTLTCDLGDIPFPGGAAVTLRVRPMALGTLTNTASVAAAEPDPEPASNSATLATAVQLPSDGVRFLTVTSTSGRNVIEWLNPAADYVSTELVFRTDRFPTSPTDGTPLYNLGTAGARDRFSHDTPPLTNGQTYYYAAFVHRSATLSPGRFVRGRPFDTSGPVKWAFSTGGFSVTPPTVGGAGVIATSNDRAVHAMARGPAGGEWPKGATAADDWHPYQVGGAVQSRSPVVPITVGGSNPVVFLGAQDGYVYALDGLKGGNAPLPWSPRLVSGGKVVQAAPAGIFQAFLGGYDYLLVGTRDGSADNEFAALDPFTGALLASFTNGGGANGIGIVSGMAAVDYASPPRVYFTSRARTGGSANTLWCLQLTATPAVFTSCSGWTHAALGDVDSSPVVRGGRVYVGSSNGGGTVYSVDAATGAADRSYVHNDGQVKGFVFPDRGSDALYFATDNYVWGVFDDGSTSMSLDFSVGLDVGARPSAALFVPGSHYVYVGGSDGKLYEIDLAGAPAVKSVPLGDGLSVVGAPSLDRGFEPNLVHVGTEAGVFYAVSVPLP